MRGQYAKDNTLNKNWWFPASLKQNLSSVTTRYLNASPAIQKYKEKITPSKDWEYFLVILDDCLKNDCDFLWLDDAQLMRLKEEATISPEEERSFLMALLNKLGEEDEILISNKIFESKKDAHDFFQELHGKLITFIVSAYNKFINSGEYGAVKHDDGLAMWSTRAPIK